MKKYIALALTILFSSISYAGPACDRTCLTNCLSNCTNDNCKRDCNVLFECGGLPHEQECRANFPK